MLFLSRYSIFHPRTVLLLAALAVILAAPGLGRLRLRTDGHALVPQDAPEVIQDRELREQFGLADSIVILIRSDDPDGIYNAHSVRLILNLTEKLHAIEGIKPSDVFSLATEKSHRVRQGTLQFLNMLDPLPQTAEELKTLHKDVDLVQLYRGTLVAEDSKAAAIFVGVRNQDDRVAIFQRILDVLDRLGPTPEKIDVTVVPVAESLLGVHILQDLGVPAVLLGREATVAIARGAAPVLEGLRLWIAGHVGLLPIALLVMTIVFYASFRSVVAVAMIWIKIGCCLLIVFGIMGWCGSPIYLTTAVIPVILTAVGVSDEVHIFSRYASVVRRRKRGEATPSSCMLEAMTEIWRPVTVTSLTTAFGFLSFAISPLAPVRSFGLFTAMGSLTCMVWALTATPALAVVLRFLYGSRARIESLGASESSKCSDVLGRLGERIAAMAGVVFASGSRRVVVIGAFAGLLVAAFFGLRRIEIQDSWIDGFSPASRFREVTQYFNDDFLGMHLLFVCVDADGHQLSGKMSEADVDHALVKIPAAGLPAGQDAAALVGSWIELKRPVQAAGAASTTQDANARRVLPGHRTQVISAVREGDKIAIGLEKFKGSPRFSLMLQAGESVEYSLTPHRFLQVATLEEIKAFENFIAAHKAEKVGGTMGPAAYVETTHFMSQGRRAESRMIPRSADQLDYIWKWYASIRGEDRMRASADKTLSSGIISVYLKNANFRDTGRLLADIRRYEREKLAPKGMSLRLAGDVAVSQALIDGITRTQVGSIALSIMGVFISAIAAHRSIKWGLLCALPCGLAVPLVLGLMGYTHIPLGVATSMFAAMAIGIGDDYAVHFVERYRLETRNSGLETRGGSPLTRTFAAAGPGIVMNAVSVSLGFGVMVLSQVPANARLGMMLIASIVACLLATLLLLPAILGYGQPSGRNELTPRKLAAGC